MACASPVHPAAGRDPAAAPWTWTGACAPVLLLSLLLLPFLLFLLLLPAQAQDAHAPAGACDLGAEPSCALYERCFAKHCPCAGGPDEYFLSYGRKYCTRFLGNEGFSRAGRQWRDNALRCLQERIVPELDLSGETDCDCAGMKLFAFQTHVACYTDPAASICALPLVDLTRIGQIIEVPELLDPLGQRQMLEVARICALTAPDDGRRAVWRGFRAVLSPG